MVNALLIELATSVEPSASTTGGERTFDGFAFADQNASTDY